MDGEIWREKRRKRRDAMKSSFIDAVGINYNAYMRNRWEQVIVFKDNEAHT